MPDINFDTFQNSPRAVVVIGKVPTIPLSYDLTMNSYLESDILNVVLTSDLIDMSKIWNKYRQENTYVPIEIWSGFIDINKNYHAFNESMLNFPSNDELKKGLVNNEHFKKVLKKRWFGILDIPTFTYNAVGGADIVTLTCKEVWTLLGEYAFEKKYDEGNCSVQAVINDLIGAIKIFKISVHPDLAKNTAKMNLQLGEKIKLNKDDGSTETVDKGWNVQNKTMLDVIQHICNVAKIDFIKDETKDDFTYIFKEPQTSDKLWTLDRGKQHFSSCTIIGGKFGHSSNATTKIGVVCKSVDKNDANNTQIGTFPKNLDNSNPASKRIKIVTLPAGKSQAECEQRASEIALSYGRYAITGTMVIPNAITSLQPDHLLKFKDTTHFNGYEHYRNMTNIAGNINFRISSVKEIYRDGVGLSQPSVEFELDLTTTINNIDTTTGEIKAYNLMPKSRDLDKIRAEEQANEFQVINRLMSIRQDQSGGSGQ